MTTQKGYCVCTKGDPCHWHAATCITCPNGKCIGHPPDTYRIVEVISTGPDIGDHEEYRVIKTGVGLDEAKRSNKDYRPVHPNGGIHYQKEV